MCNPIASKIMERNKITDISSHQSHRLDQDGDNGDNDSPDSIPEVSPPSDISSTAVASAEGSTTRDMDKNKNKTDEGVCSIREYDVLMGRGSGPNRHSGNIHFRAIVGDIFDEFLSKHGSDRSTMSNIRMDMQRIDPSTKNRLAQRVLDKITLEKNGRFLQKLTKKELTEALKKGDESGLIKARAFSLMDAAMATTMANAVEAHLEKASEGETEEAPVHSRSEKPTFNPNAVVYYKIIPEKQILAKIKQTFRFLRDQNEASNAEKHRQRVRRVAAATSGGGVPSLNSVGGIGSMQLPGGLTGGLANNSSLAATYALMERMGMNGIHPSPIQDQLSFGNSRASNSSMAMNALKNMNYSNLSKPPGGAIDLASRLLCDLPQPKRILSNSESSPGQFDSSNGNGSMASSLENSTKRLLEELTLSRLANLQKQREDTINAYLAMERGGGQGSAGMGNPSNSMNGVGISPSTLPAHQLQRLLSLNGAGPGSMAPTGNNSGLGSSSNSASDPLSLLLQLNNNNHNNGNSIGRSPSSLRTFNSTSF